MALLTTPAYDPQKQTAFVGDIIRLASQMQEAREKSALEQKARQAQQLQQSLQDQRRAFEFDRKMEFDRARTAADDARADARLSLERDSAAADNAPFTMPAANGGAPSASVPALAPKAAVPAASTPGNFSATASPAGRGGFSFSAGDAPSPSSGEFKVADGSVFGTVPDGKGGFTARDPNDRADAATPGFDPNKGAWGANIKDPSLKGVALSPTELKAAGVNLDDPSGHEVEVVSPGGSIRRYPIVDKLGKDGRIDFTGAAYKEIGGAMNEKNGGVMKGIRYRIVPKDGAPSGGVVAPALPTQDESPSAQVASTLRGLQEAGVPMRMKTVQAALPSMINAAVSVANRKAASKDKPIIRNFPDGSARQWNATTNDWDTVATKPEKADKPIVRNFADGTTRQFDHEAGTWTTLAEKAAPETLEGATAGMDYIAGHGTYRNKDGAEFFASRNGGKVSLRAFRPDTHPAKLLWGSDGNVYPHDSQGNPMKEVPEGVELRERGKLQTAHVAGVGLVAVNGDQSTTLLVPEGIKMTSKEKDAYTADLQSGLEARDELEKQKKLLAEKPRTLTSWFGGSPGKVSEAEDAWKKTDEKVKQWHERFPELKKTPVAAASEAATSAFSTADDVRAAVKTGKLSREEGMKILKSKFGFL